MDSQIPIRLNGKTDLEVIYWLPSDANNINDGVATKSLAVLVGDFILTIYQSSCRWASGSNRPVG